MTEVNYPGSRRPWRAELTTPNRAETTAMIPNSFLPSPASDTQFLFRPERKKTTVAGLSMVT